MNSTSKITLMIAVLLIAAGCREKKAEQFQALPFPNVAIPSMINTPEDAAEYMAVNFWNLLTDASRNYPSDSLLVSGVRKGEVEQKFADWTSVLDMVSPVVVEESVSRVYDRALACERKDSSSNVFETLVNLFQKYFYDPNSPLRDEERYLPFVCRYASYEGLSEVEKEKYEREARLCSLNRVGHKAADFRFSDRRGRMMNLYDVKAELTLLFFSNPGCEACMNIINVLRGEPAVSRLITDGRMAVVNVYIDEDIQEWMSYMPVYPEEWYNGFDPDLVLRNNDMYNIRAIPSLYLLDSEKRIIMKDAPEGRLFNYLSSF